MKTSVILIVPSLLLISCAKGKVKLINESKSSVSCLTELAGNSESFDTADSFTKETGNKGFLYVSCQKKTSGDLNKIRVEVLINDDVKKSGEATDEFGIASAADDL